MKAFGFFFGLPQNWWILFSVPFLFQDLVTCFSSKSLKCSIVPIFRSGLEIQGKNTWLIWKLENDRKWICSILGHFKEKLKCRLMINTSSTYSLGILWYPCTSLWNYSRESTGSRLLLGKCELHNYFKAFGSWDSNRQTVWRKSWKSFGSKLI